MKPGVYPSLSNSDYHGGPGDSKSGLDLIARSPLHFKAAADAANDNEPTAAQAFGTAFHTLVLEPEEFVRNYCLALRQADVPDAVDDREAIVAMVEALNAERVAAHPNVVRDTETILGMLKKLNEGRLAKLSTSGGKAELVARIIAAEAEQCVGDSVTAEELDKLKGDELKAVIATLNENRPGKLPEGGSQKEMAERLRQNGVDVVLWSEVQERHAAEHGTPYTLSTSAASRHDMAAWLRANGKPITLWSDVQAEWMSNNGHRIVLDQDTWDQLHAMRAAVMAHPAASALLSMRGVAEHSVYWIDQQTGMLLRCRPDWWIKERGIVVDVKTTDDASPEGFAKSIANWRYHVQHPFYIDGINEARRQIIQANEGLEFPEAVHPEVTTFVFLAVEKKSPHAVGVYMLDSLSVELGRALYRRDLETLAKCRATDTWPGYGDAIQSITVPAWEFKAHEGLLGAA